MTGQGAFRRISALGGFLLTLATTLLVLIGLVFVLGNLLPSDPVLAVVGQDATPEVYEEARRELQLDRPVHERFASYILRVVRFDFGISHLTGRPVIRDIADVLPATLELGLTGTILGGMIGTILGVVAATHKDGWQDNLIRSVSLVVYSTPSFVKALLALLLFYFFLQIAPGPGRLSIFNEEIVPVRTGFLILDAALSGEWAVMKDAMGHLFLPLMVLTAGNAAWFCRFVRTLALEEIGQEYVLTARAKGLREQTIVWTHIFLNLKVQLATISAIALAGSLESAVLIEVVFAWPGFGQYLINALNNGDMNAVAGCTALIGLFFVVANMTSERLYSYFDPRAK